MLLSTFKRTGWTPLCVLCVLFGFSSVARAQFQMPDPKQMSGIPRPVSDLPDGTVSVRLIRGDLSNNITDFPVEMQAGGKSRTVKTDEPDVPSSKIYQPEKTSNSWQRSTASGWSPRRFRLQPRVAFA